MSTEPLIEARGLRKYFPIRSGLFGRAKAWMVTSSAVVGSSAISTRGSHEIAIAIITRCRIPPES